MKLLINIELLLLGLQAFVTAAEHAPSTLHEAEHLGTEYIKDGSYLAQQPMHMEAMQHAPTPESPRHQQEKAHLRERMSRKNGKWGTIHPRYRLLEALYGYSKYLDTNLAELNRLRKLFKSVSKSQKKTLAKAVNYDKKLDDIEELHYENLMICRNIVSEAMKFYEIGKKELDDHIKEAEKSGRQADRISVGQTLKHFVRDWSDDGSKEREEAFPCILKTLETLKSQTTAEKPYRILLPGSGLGRLGHEVANLGNFEVTVNEWSMYMNLAYRFLETKHPSSQFGIHPFIDGLSHHATNSDMLRKVTAPNMAPNRFVLLVEGDFNTAFKDQGGYYDIIVTHFFIDTARNLMSYFDTIQFLLKPGGKWLNFGPLLYGTGPFVQLSLDEIIAVVETMGFEFEDIGDYCGTLTFEDKKVRSKEAEYGFNERALTKNAYSAQVWVARKV